MAIGDHMLPPSASGRTTPHLQATVPSCPSNLAIARGEEGDCTGKCLQGVSCSVDVGCSVWPPSAPVDARGNLGAVNLGTWGRDLTLSDGHQQPRWSAVSKHKHGACPMGNELQLCDSGDREDAPLLIIDKDTLPSATTFRYSSP
jgi:hypothetical protein